MSHICREKMSFFINILNKENPDDVKESIRIYLINEKLNRDNTLSEMFNRYDIDYEADTHISSTEVDKIYNEYLLVKDVISVLKSLKYNL